MAYNVGKSLKLLTTTCLKVILSNIQGNDLGHRKNVIDWVIRG